MSWNILLQMLHTWTWARMNSTCIGGESTLPPVLSHGRNMVATLLEHRSSSRRCGRPDIEAGLSAWSCILGTWQGARACEALEELCNVSCSCGTARGCSLKAHPA